MIDYMSSHILTSCQPINLFTKRSVLYIMTAVWMKSTSVCTETSGSVFMRLLKVCFLEEDDASVSSMSLRLLSSIRHPYLFMHHKQHHLSRLVHTESFIMVHGDGRNRLSLSATTCWSTSFKNNRIHFQDLNCNKHHTNTLKNWIHRYQY